MKIHHGQIIKNAIQSDYSITDVANLANINRRLFYHFLSQKRLKHSVIAKVGHVLNYDFSEEIAELTPDDDSSLIDTRINWEEKYFHVLKKYDEIVGNKIKISF